MTISECEDAVSRQAVEEMIKAEMPERGMWEIEGDKEKETVCEVCVDLTQKLSGLPSVNTQSCEDAVSRQAALRQAINAHKMAQENGFDFEDICEEYLNVLPPVRPQESEQKTGHWIGDKAYPICPKCNCNIIEEYISCSDYAEMYKPMKYCPNCGAKMIEPHKKEVKA